MMIIISHYLYLLLAVPPTARRHVQEDHKDKNRTMGVLPQQRGLRRPSPRDNNCCSTTSSSLGRSRRRPERYSGQIMSTMMPQWRQMEEGAGGVATDGKHRPHARHQTQINANISQVSRVGVVDRIGGDSIGSNPDFYSIGGVLLLRVLGFVISKSRLSFRILVRVLFSLSRSLVCRLESWFHFMEICMIVSNRLFR